MDKLDKLDNVRNVQDVQTVHAANLGGELLHHTSLFFLAALRCCFACIRAASSINRRLRPTQGGKNADKYGALRLVYNRCLITVEQGEFEMSDVSADDAAGKPLGSRADRKVKPTARSRVGNGKVLLSGIDPHTVPYREFRDVVSDLVEHLGSAPTAVERALIEETAGLVIWCRQARLALLQGEEFDVGKYSTAVNSLRRLLADLGLQARLKDVTSASVEEIFADAEREGQMNVTEALRNPRLFGQLFAGPSWARWRAVLKAVHAEPLDDDEAVLFREVADRNPPTERARELVAVVGRGGGKDSIASFIAAYAAITFEPRGRLRPGENAYVLCIACDRDQAQIAFGYIKGLFESIPALKQKVRAITAEFHHPQQPRHH